MRSSFRFASIVSATVLLGTLAACVAPTSSAPVSSYPNNYPANTYPVSNNQSGYVEYGRVANIEVIRTQEQGSNNVAGTVIGGVVGGVLGNQVGGGSGRDAATVIGAVGGAIAGNQIQKNRNANNVNETFRVSVQVENGSYRAYDLTSPGDLRIGDRVRIQNGQLYRS